MRLSRWGRSAYEGPATVAAERRVLEAEVEVLEDRSDAEIVVVNSKQRVDAAMLARVPSCQVVITSTSGFDHIDLPSLAARGVSAARLPEARAGAVTDSAIGFLLAGLRGLGTLGAAAEAGQWARPVLDQHRLSAVAGQTIGVVGQGVIGRRVVKVLHALGARVWACDPAGLADGTVPAQIEQMAERCVALTLHCDLNPGTVGLVDQSLLDRARSGLVLVNTARGGLVDVEAARRAVVEGRLGALCLDVFPREPPADLAALAAHPRVFLTPHSAGYHQGLLDQLDAELARTVRAWRDGTPLPHPLPRPRSRPG